MIARLLMGLLLGQALAIALVAALLAHWLEPAWLALLAACLVALLVRMGITANNFLLSQLFGSPTPAPFRLGPLAALGMFLREYGATLFHSSWSMVWGRAGLLPGSSAHPPVLFIHGYACNSGYWRRLPRALARRGIGHATLDLEPIGASIDAYAEQIAAGLAALGPQPAIIVAHSMGGLAARAYLRRHGAQGVLAVITLGTPHQGTALARFGPGENAAQMRPGHPWLAALAASETAQTRALFTSIYSHHDNIIAPQTSSELAGARHVALGGIGHVAMGNHPDIVESVLQEINRVATSSKTALD